MVNKTSKGFNKMLKKIPKIKIAIMLFLFSFLSFQIAIADSGQESLSNMPDGQTVLSEGGTSETQETFRAEVIEIVREDRKDTQNCYQDIKLIGKTGSFKDKEIIYKGVTEKISSKYFYKVGDVVFMSATKIEGKDVFIINDKSRLSKIYLLFLLFAVTIIAIGRKHGLKSLISLVLTVLVIVCFVVPRILNGAEPVRTVVLFSLFIVVLSMVIVYGWNKKSKIAISGMIVGVVITAMISKLFTDAAFLTGNTAEEIMYLKDYIQTEVDFRGLLLASFILGSLGVLDDIAITQVSTVKEISETDASLDVNSLYKRSMRVGTDHIASMINTLFLAYAGASFILLLLFGIKQAPFETVSDVINNELVATEIVRTLAGSIGLILTVPITTYIASLSYGSKEVNTKNKK